MGYIFPCRQHRSVFIQIYVADSVSQMYNVIESITVVQGHSRLLISGKCVCAFLLVINSNHGPNLHHFGDTMYATSRHRASIATFIDKLSSKPRYESFFLYLNLFPSLSGKIRDIGLSVSEDFVILSCVALT